MPIRCDVRLYFAQFVVEVGLTIESA